MTQTDFVKSKIAKLYKTNPNIHIQYAALAPRGAAESIPATIKGVYRHIFQIEESSSGKVRKHTVQYSEVIMRRIVIEEFDLPIAAASR